MFKNFRNFNRDLTKAYLRQAETFDQCSRTALDAATEEFEKERRYWMRKIAANQTRLENLRRLREMR